MIYSASEILKMEEPGQLFSDNIKTIKEEYTDLAKKYHPDRNKNSKESIDVMAIVNTFYTQCIDMINSGTYKKPGFIKLAGKDEQFFEIKYRISHNFELGTVYIGNSIVFYLIDKAHKNLFENMIKISSTFTFVDKKMKTEFEKYLPIVIRKFETTTNQLGIVIKKTADFVALRDVLNYYEGKVPARHVAWIISSLMNLVCYINYNGLSHNSISLDTYFISPKLHSGSLLGGWWYSVPLGTKMLGVSEKIYSIMPPQVKNKKCGDILTDLESIRLIGRELLGDRHGTRMLEKSYIPLPMAKWLLGVSYDSPSVEYTKWTEVLHKSFGERKFIEMELDANKLYSKIKK